MSQSGLAVCKFIGTRNLFSAALMQVPPPDRLSQAALRHDDPSDSSTGTPLHHTLKGSSIRHSDGHRSAVTQHQVPLSPP